MKIKLRDYQRKFIDDIREQMQQGHKRVCGVAPCGSTFQLLLGALTKCRHLTFLFAMSVITFLQAIT